LRVSIDWLKEFVQIEETPFQLADLLSNTGIEAEVSKIPMEIPGVIIGKVETTEKHPNADKLKLCTVNDGKKTHQVVCGATNVAAGQTIPFAMIGAILPGNFKIKKVKIRGVESSGMICSERELNISDEHEGIMVLPDFLHIGDDFMKSYGYKFLSLELDITPNRPDAFSHQGVARDISAATERKFSPLIISNIESKKNLSLNISMEDHNDCPRYIGGLVENIKVGPSPDWLIDRLRSIGQRSINNIVDISNYVLMEMGHPTHIFDFGKLKEKDILVRRAKKGETLVTLDEQKHKLDEKHLLITDGNYPIALAGIMGGLNTAVTDSTKSLLVESAYFDPVTIRKSAKSLSMSTDASKRYERGVDPNGCSTAFWRIISLLEDLCGGIFSSRKIDVYPRKISPLKVTLRRSELDLVIGISIETDSVNKILNNLGIQNSYNNVEWSCTIPTYRPDITREIDLIEEVARINGYNEIPSDYSLNGRFRFKNPDPEKYLIEIRQTLISCGFHQIYSNSLQSENHAKLSGHEPIKMMNPLNKDMGYLRTSLIPGLMKAADLNIKHSNSDLRIFELGHVHFKNNSVANGVEEKKYLSGLVIGEKRNNSVHSDIILEDLYSIKGYLETLFVKKLSMRMEFENIDKISFFDLSRNLIVNRKNIGQFGRISTEITQSLDLDIKVAYGFEINLELIKNMIDRKSRFKPIVQYPKISRDINLVMPEEQEVGKIVELFYKIGKKLVVNAKPVNIFFDTESIGKGNKSVTFNITFQSSSKTLEDKDVNHVIDEIIIIVDKDFNAKLRA